jgi:type I restriction enzyme S subunit
VNQDFRESTIEEMCNVEYGTRVVRKKDAGTIYPVYGGGGETFFLDTFNRENRVVVARFAMSEKCTRRVLGKFALNDSGLTLSPKDTSKLRQDYLDYYILSLNNQIYESARGTAQKNLDVPAFRQMKVIYPTSIEKQQEIVKKLDRAFAEIDLSGIHLRKRVSSYCLLEEAFINERLRQNCESFTSKKLSDITSKIGSGATPRGGEESYKSEGISLIRSLNVYDDGFREKKLAFIDEVQAKALANVEIKTGDVLINITGASIARTCIAPKEYLPARVNQHVSIIRPKPEIISTEYLHFLLRSQRMKSSLLGVGNSGGSTRQALTKVDLENTIIEFPPDLENQKEAVDELKSFGDLSKTFMNNLSKLESLYSDLQNSLLISELSGSII